MANLIDKDALLAEIERKKTEEVDYDEDSKNFASYADQIHYSALDSMEDFINTLEAKEVDLEEVFNNEYSKFSNDTDAMDYAFPIDRADFKDFAKHFFELGLKAKQG